MTKPIETLTGADATAFRSAISPHVQSVLDGLITNPAQVARDAAVAAKTGAETARDGAVAAQTGSQTARDASVTAKTGAETARDAAVAAKTGAETAKTGSETARDAAQVARTGAETAQQAYLNLFASVDLSIIGSKIMRFRDAAGRVAMDLDIDAGIGFTFYAPANFPVGTIPLTALVNSPLVVSTNEANGYAFRFMAPDGVHQIGGIPVSYPGRPADLNVLRARYADSFAGAVDSTGTWFLGSTIDAITGQQTLWTRKVATGDFVQITASGHAMAPRIDGVRAMWIDGVNERAMYRPLDGSDIARAVNPGTGLIIIGDSTGQSLENASGAGIGGGMTTVGGKVRRLYGISRGSQLTRQIATRYGVPGLSSITFAGGSIAPTASGATACAVDWDFMVDAGGQATSYVGSISVPSPSGAVVGVLTRTWSGSAPVWTFTPDALAAAVAVPTGAQPITVLRDVVSGTTAVASAQAAKSIEDMREVTAIIRTGRNDIGKAAGFTGPAYDPATCVTQIKGIIARISSLYKQAIVLGVMQTYASIPTGQGSDGGGTNTGTDAQCSASFEADLAYNAALLAAFGTAYFDPVANHKAAGFTATWTSTTTGKTYTYVTSAAIADGTHESAAGYNNTWAGLVAVLTAKGF